MRDATARRGVPAERRPAPPQLWLRHAAVAVAEAGALMLNRRLGLDSTKVPHADRVGCLYLVRGALTARDGTLVFLHCETTLADALGLGDDAILLQGVSIILLGPGSSREATPEGPLQTPKSCVICVCASRGHVGDNCRDCQKIILSGGINELDGGGDEPDVEPSLPEQATADKARLQDLPIACDGT